MTATKGTVCAVHLLHCCLHSSAFAVLEAMLLVSCQHQLRHTQHVTLKVRNSSDVVVLSLVVHQMMQAACSKAASARHADPALYMS